MEMFNSSNLLPCFLSLSLSQFIILVFEFDALIAHNCRSIHTLNRQTKDRKREKRRKRHSKFRISGNENWTNKLSYWCFQNHGLVPSTLLYFFSVYFFSSISFFSLLIKSTTHVGASLQLFWMYFARSLSLSLTDFYQSWMQTFFLY